MSKRKIIAKECKVCGSKTINIVDPQMKVTYSHCEKCDFIYKQPEYHISKIDELKVYSNHNNSFESIGYVKMFEQLIKEYINPLNISGKGLEFGSGPGPVLFELLKRNGFEMYQYDPFYHKSKEYLNYQYEIITSTEVAEHFSDPIKEFKHLSSLLSDDGYLVIMTAFRTMNIREFLNWWYKRDKTHISFYNLKTFQFIANKLNLKIVNTNDKNIIVMKKQTTSE